MTQAEWDTDSELALYGVVHRIVRHIDCGAHICLLTKCGLQRPWTASAMDVRWPSEGCPGCGTSGE